MKVSVVVTVLNEDQSIHKLLDSLVAQTHRPDEVVVVDGGSIDQTLAILEDYTKHLPLKIIHQPGANISQGRNVAIEAAVGPIIACTDVGVRLAENWLASLMDAFSPTKVPAVVAGFFVPDPQSTFEVAMGATVLPRIDEIDPHTFLPSSRSIAFHKTAWQTVGGYPEWLDFCEDLIFDFKLKDLTGDFSFAPQAIAHFRPRSTLRAFYKQYYQYARGDGKADLWRKRHAIRYLTYLVALPLLILVGFLVTPWWWLAGAMLGGWGLFYTPYKRLFSMWSALSWVEKGKAFLWIPIIRLTGDFAKMIGYPVGLAWRFKRLKIDQRSRA